MEQQVLTAQEAAKVLNVSLSTIYNLRDRGTLPQIKDLPGVRFATKDVLSIVGVDALGYSPRAMQELQRELVAKDERIKALEATLKGTASSILDALRREGI